jgi:hypothetical protein
MNYKKSREDIERYLDAFNYWQQMLTNLHAILFDEKEVKDPSVIKGALNREARAKEKYEEQRKEIFGIG